MSLKATDIVQFNLTGALLMLIANYHEQYDPTHSLEFVIEECLLAGVQAKQRSKDYSEQTRNRKDFEKAIATDPLIVLDPKRMTALMRKYKIGGISNPTNGANPLAAIEAAIASAAAPAPSVPPATATAATEVPKTN
jgi:hypothetical protein